jgi:DNA-binding CsgD family transcriptional regulator
MPRLAHRAQDRAERADPGLTRAQSAVLGLVGQGLTTARIAAQLGMSPATVEAVYGATTPAERIR